MPKNFIPASREILRALKGDIQIGSNDYTVAFKLIEPDWTFNKREDYGDIEELAANILANGQKMVVLGDFVYNEKKPTEIKFIMNDGFRRYLAFELLYKTNPKIKVICRTNEKGTTKKERYYNQFITQDNKKLNDLEVAAIFREMVDSEGETPDDILKNVTKSITYIKDMLILSHQTDYVKQAIRNKQTSSTAVIKIAKDMGPEKTEDFIRKSIEGNIKVSVNTAEKVHKEKKEKLKVQVEMPFNIPETLEDMIKMRDDLLLITNRTVDQERQLGKLDDRIREEELNRKPETVYEPVYAKDLIKEGSEFSTILLTNFNVNLMSILESENVVLEAKVMQNLAAKIFRFFRDELEPEA